MYFNGTTEQIKHFLFALKYFIILDITHKGVFMKNQTILILDFGGQYRELISRSIRRMNVYSVVKPHDVSIDEIKEINPIGIIFTGSPNSVYLENHPTCSQEVFSLGIPILGICYGMQYMAHCFGGRVQKCEIREFGQTDVSLRACTLFKGLGHKEVMLMSHSDHVAVTPQGFEIVATTADCSCAAIANEQKRFYGVQFHPEVELSVHGMQLLENFVVNICHATKDYSLDDYIDTQIKQIRNVVGDKKVLLGLSGGIDSAVVAALMSKAVPDKLLCVYVDHGFMRKNETDFIKKSFSNLHLNLEIIDASERFLNKLRGVTDPERKRKLIGEEFVNVFYEVAKSHAGYQLLAQGTIYSDVVESGINNSSNIKSHHNVGGLPENLPFEGLVEPLRNLFKDEVRSIGRKLGLPDGFIDSQPFPGPGLAIRIIGEVTQEKLNILKDADAILREEIISSNIKPDQYFAVLTDTKSVGVIGDYRNYGYVIALRAVTTSDFMTAEYTHLPYELLTKISSRIVNEVKGVSRVCYDITSKPPATIEWE